MICYDGFEILRLCRICLVISFDWLYGFVVDSGNDLLIGECLGMLYMVVDELNMNCLMLCLCMILSMVSSLLMLFW